MKNGDSQDLKPDPAIRKLVDVKFFLTYSKDKGFQCEREGLDDTGNPQYDQKAREISGGIEKEVVLFSRAWNTMLGLGKNRKQKPVFKVTRAQDGYWLSETLEGQTGEWHFNHDGLLTEATIPAPTNETGPVHLGFTFKKVTGSYLPEKITFKTEKNGVSGEVKVDYEELENFQMPEKVKWSCTYPDKDKGKGSTGDYLAFYNYEINGVTVTSPLPSHPGIDWLYVMQRAFDASVEAGIEYHVAFGPFLSNSPSINSDYGSYNGDFGIGFEFTPAFSLSFDVRGADYKNHATGYDLNTIDLLLVGKYRLFTGDVRPYLTAGLGVGLADYFQEGNYTQSPAQDTGFVTEAGGGLEVQVLHSLFLYAQTGYVSHPFSSSYAQMVGVESSFHYVPIQFGITFER